MIITIDGPVATGKSTISKKLAKRLGIPCFDTGAMYRVFAWIILHQGISLGDTQALLKELKDFSLDMRIEGEKIAYFYGEREITQAIREPEISTASSLVAVVPQVRHKMVEIQRGAAEGRNMVFEGRDLGSVVFPSAEVKFYLDGRAEVRAERRLKELQTKFPGQIFHFEKVLEELLERDRKDMEREVSPLIRPKDAFVIDTSDKTVEQIVEEMAEISSKKCRG